MYEYVKGKGWIDLAENMAFTKNGLLVQLEDRRPEIGERWIYNIEGIERAKRSISNFNYAQLHIYGLVNPVSRNTYVIKLV